MQDILEKAKIGSYVPPIDIQDPATNTVPKILRYQSRKYGNKKVAMRKKSLGIWQEYHWEESYAHVKKVCLGLVALGLHHGEKVSIVGDNDPEWFWAEWAVQSVGGVAVGLYVDSIPDELQYIINHSESVIVFAKDQEQVDKILSFIEKSPQIRKIIYWEYKGMWKYEQPLLISWGEVEELGRKYEEEHPGKFDELIDQTKPEDLALISYTSGTTGLPKGALASHWTMLANAFWQLVAMPWSDADDYLSYLPPAWVGEQFFGIAGGLIAGPRINFPEEPETVTENLREIAPKFLIFNPRLWESIASTIQAKMIDAYPLKRFFYNRAQTIGYKRADAELAGKQLNFLERVINKVADLVVFRCVRDRMGLSGLRFGITGGGPLSPECFRFFRALNVPIRQIFGSSEILPLTAHISGKERGIEGESIGFVAPGREVRIMDDNEILGRGDGLCLGYYKDPEKTAEALGDGWYHSGDAGHLIEEGKVIYWDRVKDLLELSSGIKFPPQYIEGKLKFSPYVKDCMVVGGKDRGYVSVIIALDYEICSRWAESLSIAYTTFIDLSQKDEIIELISKDIRKVNRNLPEAQRVKKFANLHKEFDPDEAELTRTRKLRRAFMEDRYKAIIEGMYSEKKEVDIEAPVVYRDGRRAVVKTVIKINKIEE